MSDSGPIFVGELVAGTTPIDSRNLEPRIKGVSSTSFEITISPLSAKGKIEVVITKNNASLPSGDDAAWKQNLKDGNDHTGAAAEHHETIEVTSASTFSKVIEGFTASDDDHFIQILHHGIPSGGLVTPEPPPPVSTGGGVIDLSQSWPRIGHGEVSSHNMLQFKSYRDNLAKADIVILNSYPGYTTNDRGGANDFPGDGIAEAAKYIKDKAAAIGNTGLKLFHYAYIMQVPVGSGNEAYATHQSKMDAEGWWLLRNGSQRHSQWVGANTINVTRAVPKDSAGLWASEWMAQWWYENLLLKATSLDGPFFDDIHEGLRGQSGNVNRTGGDESPIDDDITQTEAQTALHHRDIRIGKSDAVARMRALAPDAPIILNNPPNFADVMGNMGSAEYSGTADSMIEGPMGYATFSPDYWGGRAGLLNAVGAYQHYMKTGRLRSGLLMVMNGGMQTDYRQMRNCLAMVCVMGDGHSCYTAPAPDLAARTTNIAGDPINQGQILTGGHTWSGWHYDEYDQDLGLPVEAPPVVGNPNLGVMYKRDFQRGTVIWNPLGNGTQRVVVPNNRTRFLGDDDPVRNNGTRESFDLDDADGVILVAS